MLNRNDILTKDNLKKMCVSVPAWGGDVFVSEMSAATRDQWEKKLVEEREESDKISSSRAALVIITVVDEKGNPLFTEKDIPQIGKLSSMALDPVIKAAQKLNGLDIKIEEAEKN